LSVTWKPKVVSKNGIPIQRFGVDAAVGLFEVGPLCVAACKICVALLSHAWIPGDAIPPSITSGPVGAWLMSAAMVNNSKNGDSQSKIYLV
jgi:hypothetical protein